MFEINSNSHLCALWGNYSPTPLDKQLCKTTIFGLSFAPPKMLSVGAPRREKRLRIDRSALYIVRGCSVRRRLTKQFANLPHKMFILRGPRIYTHEKSCGFYAGTPDSAVENAAIRMRCAPSLSRKTAIFERQTRKCPFRKRERTKSYVTAFLPHRKYFRRGPLCGRGFDAVSRQSTPQNFLRKLLRGHRARLKTPSFG